MTPVQNRWRDCAPNVWLGLRSKVTGTPRRHYNSPRDATRLIHYFSTSDSLWVLLAWMVASRLSSRRDISSTFCHVSFFDRNALCYVFVCRLTFLYQLARHCAEFAGQLVQQVVYNVHKIWRLCVGRWLYIALLVWKREVYATAGMHRTLGEPDTLSRLICAESVVSLSEDMLMRWLRYRTWV